MTFNQQTLTPVEEFLIHAKPDEQLAVVTFSSNNSPKYQIQDSADSHYLQYLIQYLGNISTKHVLPEGKLLCSLHDAIWKKDNFPILTFGRRVGEARCFLIPDPFFIKAQGYMEDYVFIDKHNVLWEDRKSVAYFRGSSTGGQLNLSNWRKNPRVQLALRTLERPNLMDAKVTLLVQEEEPGVGDEMKKAGIVGEFEPPETCLNYKYVFDVDGNANSWGYFLKLAMGCLVFKVESLFEQWFYQWMRPWIHYVPVKADFSDLVEQVQWARANDSEARQIAENGKEFARSLNYDRSLEYGADIITAAMKVTPQRL